MTHLTKWDGGGGGCHVPLGTTFKHLVLFLVKRDVARVSAAVLACWWCRQVRWIVVALDGRTCCKADGTFLIGSFSCNLCRKGVFFPEGWGGRKERKA